MFEEIKNIFWRFDIGKDDDSDNDSIEALVLLCDEFTIGFSEWKDKISDSDLKYSTKYSKSNQQLLEMYKKEKGL